MKTVGIIYVCIGKYDVFWKEFYESCEKYFLDGYKKRYYILTDKTAQDLSVADNPDIVIFNVDDLGWPLNTLRRFEFYDLTRSEWRNDDYVFFFNSNYLFQKPVGEEILPSSEEGMAALSWNIYKTKPVDEFPYDRNEKSHAYIPFGQGRSYYQGGLHGGTIEAFSTFTQQCLEWMLSDTENGVIALWHDESYLNRYLLDKTVRVLDESFGMPQERKGSESAYGVFRIKSNYISDTFLKDLKTPLLSVILCLDNSLPYLDKTIDSVINQDYKNIELILVNSGVSDNTQKFISKYKADNRVIIVDSDNGSLSNARNAGINKAQGGYITFIESGDVVTHDTYSANMAFVEKEGSIDILQFPINSDAADEEQRIVQSRSKLLNNKRKIYSTVLSDNFSFSVSNKIFNNQAIGGLRFANDRFFEEVEFNFQLIKKSRMMMISDKGEIRKKNNSDFFIIRDKASFDKIQDYFKVVFEIVSEAQYNGVSPIVIYKFISDWCKLHYFSNMDDLTVVQLDKLRSISSVMKIENKYLIIYFLTGKLGLARVKSLYQIMKGEVDKMA